MRQVRHMLRLARDGVHARETGRTLGISRSTVQDDLARASAAGLRVAPASVRRAGLSGPLSVPRRNRVASRPSTMFALPRRHLAVAPLRLPSIESGGGHQGRAAEERDRDRDRGRRHVEVFGRTRHRSDRPTRPSKLRRGEADGLGRYAGRGAGDDLTTPVRAWLGFSVGDSGGEGPTSPSPRPASNPVPRLCPPLRPGEPTPAGNPSRRRRSLVRLTRTGRSPSRGWKRAADCAEPTSAGAPDVRRAARYRPLGACPGWRVQKLGFRVVGENNQ